MFYPIIFFERDNRTALLPLRWNRSVSLLILLPRTFGNLRGCRIRDYLQLSAQIYSTLYLLPNSYVDSSHRWLVYVKVSITSVVLLYLSEFRLIQPLRWDFSFTLTHNKVIRIASYFILKVPSSTTIVGYCQHLAEYQLTTSLGADCLMGF